MRHKGEYDVYHTAQEVLNRSIAEISARVDLNEQVAMLDALRTRVARVCLSEEYLLRYKTFLESFETLKHCQRDKLRDADSKYLDEVIIYFLLL